MGIARRVLNRFTRTASWEGKLVGKDFRLTWTYHDYKLEELPAKGKRKLRVAHLQSGMSFNTYANKSPLIPENIFRSKNIGASDDYDSVKRKLREGLLEAAEPVIAEDPRMDFLRKIDWSEEQVHFLQVTPENVEPFTAKGKDFGVYVSWTEFEATSPDSDFQQSDPSYSKIVSTAAASARKLYQTLKTNPTALSGISYDKFDEWLKGQKINYKYEHSVWH